jgi:putative DNA primase/helicase
MPPVSIRDAALDWVQKTNLPIFAVEKDEKFPKYKGWQSIATCVGGDIEKIFAQPGLNIGYRTGRLPDGSHTIVIDIESKEKKGQDGLASILEAAAKAGKNYKTIEDIVMDTGAAWVKTPHGGHHLLFDARGLPDFVNREAILPGVDLRAQGGLALAPGSSIPGLNCADRKYYTWGYNPGSFAPVPDWIVPVLPVRQAEAPKGLNGGSRIEVSGEGQQQAVFRAVAAIHAAPIVPEGGRNGAALRMAIRLANDFLLEDFSAEGLLRYYNKERLDPPLPDEELAGMIERGKRAARGEPGADNPEVQRLRLVEGVTDAEVWQGRPQKAQEGAKAGPVQSTPKEPVPLSTPLLPVQAFDFDLLPVPLQAWARDIQEAMQCPAGYIGASIMIALGAVIGRKIVIRPKVHGAWAEAANNFGMAIGRPGVKKSPAIADALKPLNKLEAEARERHGADMVQYERLEAAVESRKKAARRAMDKEAGGTIETGPHVTAEHLIRHFEGIESPEEPKMRRYITNDCNAASLGELLRNNPNGLLVHRDELASLFDNFEREDMVGLRGFILEAWKGTGSHTIDRIGRGEIHIPAACLSLFGTIQPGRLAEHIHAAIEGGRGDDGFLQRFQFAVWPDTTEPRWVDREPDLTARSMAYSVFKDLDAGTLALERGAANEPPAIPYLRFAPDAQERFKDWSMAWQRWNASAGHAPAIEAHMAKYEKLVPSTALVLHLAGYGQGPVSLAALEKAIRWADYLKSHAMRIYNSGPVAAVAAANTILQKIKSGDLKDGFTKREIVRKCWAGLGKEITGDALDMLEDHNWLQKIEQKSAIGRPAEIYALNPLAKF